MKLHYHFNEPKVLEELQIYIDSTYHSHYVGEDDVQAFDLISAAGHGEGFCIGNIIKLASRYGKKAGKNKQDLMKILHYGTMLMNIHNKKEETKDDRPTPTKPRKIRN